MTKLRIHNWIKTPCGRAKFSELSAKPGAMSQIRLLWFVAIAIIRDWNIKNPDQGKGSTS